MPGSFPPLRRVRLPSPPRPNPLPQRGRGKRVRGFDVILLDIDNVLIDTRASYLAAIRKTVETYLKRPGVISAKDVDNFKLLGGFNDDWDACYGIVMFLETAIQGKPIRFGDHRRERFTISELGVRFPERPLGIEGLRKRLKVLYEKVEIPSYKKIASIFQKVYLGHPPHPPLSPQRGERIKVRGGLIQKEKLIFPKALLQKIRKKGVKFGIVTGRNRLEADYALKRFGIRGLFDTLVTIDDVKREEKKTGKVLRKPDPWPILEAAKRFTPHPNPLPPRGRGKGEGKKSLRFLYVGDLPDDVLAANRAKRFLKIKAAAFPLLSGNSNSLAREFRKVQPDFFLKKPADLLKLLA